MARAAAPMARRGYAVLRRRRRIGRSRIERLMREAGLHGLAALPRRTRMANSRCAHPSHPTGSAGSLPPIGPAGLPRRPNLPAKAGFTLPPYWICRPARSSAGPMRETLHTEIALETLTMAISRGNARRRD